jgi:hypothetical protein
MHCCRECGEETVKIKYESKCRNRSGAVEQRRCGMSRRQGVLAQEAVRGVDDVNA